MTSSGMKRGLAVTAVSALAVTGLPFLTATANATPLAEQIGADALHLYTADGDTQVSVRNDGQNATVHLVANGGANVAQVRYSYVFNGTETVIDTVSRSNGVFSLEWAPATNLLGELVTLKAHALSNAGGELGAALTRDVTVSANATSVDIANAPGSNVGVFKQQYASSSKTGNLGVVGGTTSELTDDVTLNGVAVNAANGGEYGEPTNGVRTFKGVAEFGAYPFDEIDPKLDQAVVTAQVDTDDNEAVQVYAQKITSVSASVANANPPASNPATTATVTVLDQRNNPIAGAEVVRTGGPTVYTDVNGKATFAVTGSAAGSTYVFTVNVDDDADYQPAKDYQRSVTVTTYSDAAAAVTAHHSKLGDALDRDEYDEAPVSITVTDGRGAARNGQTVQYSWSLNKFEPADDPTTVVATGNVTTGTDGKANIPAPVGADGTYILNTYIEQDGNPGQTAGDISGSTLRVKIGEASIVWEDGNVSQAPAGSSKEFDAKLVLADGTPLPNREVTFNYTPGSEPTAAGDSIVAANQPGNTVRIGNNSAKDVTNTFGTVSVSLTDPSEATQPKELGADLNAETTGANEANASNSGDSLTVDWLTSLAPVDEGDILVDTDELIDGIATPGRPVSLDIEVRNADNELLTDYPVEVSVDHGSFTTTADSADELVADPAAAAGGLYGEWDNIGDEQHLLSDDAGLSEATVNIERDRGFDDDGHVEMNVTIKAGPVTKVVPIDFVSGEDGVWDFEVLPLNPGQLTVKRSAQQTISRDVLPNAPTTEYVNFDVIATDQFGNRVKAYVDISDNSTADVAEWVDSRYDCWNTEKSGGFYCYDQVEDEEFYSPVNLENNDEGGYEEIENGDWVESQFTSEKPELRASSDVATTQRITGEWTHWNQNTWEAYDSDAGTPGEQTAFRRDTKSDDSKVLTDTAATINWYVIDWDNLKSSLSRDTRSRVLVDTSVTETVTVKDQMGEPVQGLDVEFIRSGPNDQLGEDNEFGTTNANGQTRYTFVGTERGLAKVTAVVSRDTDGDGDADEVVDKPTNSVRFVKERIEATLDLENVRGGKDRAVIRTDSESPRAEVELYKVTKDGKRVLIREGKLNRNGVKRWTVADAKKNRFTKFVAVVSSTRTKSGDTTPSRRIR